MAAMRKRVVVPVSIVVVLVTIAGAYLGLGLGNSKATGAGVSLSAASLPAEDPALAVQIRDFLSGPVQVQHRLFTRNLGEPVLTGLGHVDLSAECRFDVVYTGPLYQVEMRSEGGQLWTRSTKRETGSQSAWELNLPLATNINSSVFALAGNPSLLYCNLGSIARSLRLDGTSYQVDRDALSQLLAAQRQQELSALLVLADASAEERAQVMAGAKVDTSVLMGLLESVVVETDNRGTMRIAVTADGGRVVEELMLRRTDAMNFESPAASGSRGDQRAQSRTILGLDN
jgi:hypothetical protein